MRERRQSELYVATNGDDTADGTTTCPCRTLQHAAQDVQSGDLIIVRPGRYVGFVLGRDGPQNGTSANPITFRGESEAIIDTRNNRTADGINLEGACFIVIEGFAITNGGTIPRAGNVVMDRFTIEDGPVQNLAQWRQQTGQDRNSGVATPTAPFVSPTGNDYQLLSNSPPATKAWSETMGAKTE